MEPGENLSGQLIYAGRLCRALRADLLQEFGIHAGQDLLLKSLSQNDGQTMSSIARELGVRPPTVTKMVARMESQGLLRRQDSPTDNRSSHVHLTEDGRRLLAHIDEAWQKTDDLVFGELRAKDGKRLAKILVRIITSLGGEVKSGQDSGEL